MPRTPRIRSDELRIEQSRSLPDRIEFPSYSSSFPRKRESGSALRCARPTLGFDEPLDQPIDLGRFLHMGQMAGVVEDMDRHFATERRGMRDRDDAVVAPPDYLRRHRQTLRKLGPVRALDAVREPFV